MNKVVLLASLLFIGAYCQYQMKVVNETEWELIHPNQGDNVSSVCYYLGLFC